MTARQTSEKAKSDGVFGQRPKQPKMLDSRMQVREVGSGATQRERREKLLGAARRWEIDVVLV